MPRGYGIGYGSIGPNPWASANAAQYLGPGAQFQTLAGAPGSAGGYWTAVRPGVSIPSPSTSLSKIEWATPAGPALKPSPKKGFFASIKAQGLYKDPCPGGKYSKKYGCSLKPAPKRTYQQPRNPVVPAGDSAPYKGSEAPIAAPSKGGTLSIGFGGKQHPYFNRPTQKRITVPQDATQTRQQVKAGRKQIKLPEPEALAAIGGAGLLLVLL